MASKEADLQYWGFHNTHTGTIFIYRIIKTYSNLGSRGVRAPNSLMILMSIQLLVDDVISLKKVGARER
jgi:hypothetical protein